MSSNFHNNSNTNTSWRSHSLDHGDDGGNDDSGSLHSGNNNNNNSNNNNTSLNSSYNSRNKSSSSSSRYNHYRRDPPTRVKPWMRDVAVVGSVSAAASSSGRRSGRFGGEKNVHSSKHRHVLSEPSSNSCSNSVSSSASSYRSFNKEDQHYHHIPREVTSSTHNISCVSHDEDDDVDDEYSFNQSSIKEEGVVHHEEQERTRAATTRTQLNEEGEDGPIGTELKTPRVANLTAAAETEETGTSTKEDEIDNLNERDLPQGEVPSKEPQNVEKTSQEGQEVPENPNDNESVPTVPNQNAQDDELAEEGPSKEEPEQPSTNLVNEHDDDEEEEDERQINATESDMEDIRNMLEDEPAPEEIVEDEKHAAANNEEPKNNEKEDEEETMPESDSASSEKSPSSYEVFDELPQVQPSSYNPMAAVSIKKEEPTPASVYSTMEKTTPLVASQGELLNDAIEEEEEYDDDEEPSFDDAAEEEKQTRVETVVLQKVERKTVLSLQDEEIPEFYRLWPRCVSESGLPTVKYPIDWNEQQQRAIQATKTWIQQEQEADENGDKSSTETTEEDKKEDEDQDETYYCQFAKALKNCPALTTGFFVSKEADDNNYNDCCFCPCSTHMEEWRRHYLGGVVDDVMKCGRLQFTPRDLLQHCEEVASDCGDTESRVLHAVIHKYLEFLFGEQEGLAHFFEATLVGDESEAEEEVLPNDANQEKNPVTVISDVQDGTEEKLGLVRQEIQRLEDLNSDLTEKLMLAEERVEIQEAKEVKTAAFTKEQTEKLRQISDNMNTLQEANFELLEKLKLAEQREQHEASKSADVSSTIKAKEDELSKLSDNAKELEETNASLLKRMKIAEEKAKIEEARNIDAVASSQAQAEMMSGLCEELKQMEQKNAELTEKLELAETKERQLQSKNSDVASEKEDAHVKFDKLSEEMKELQKTNADLTRKLKLAEESVQSHASELPRSLVHVGDTPVDVGRFRIQCQKYFNHLRVNQLKIHCIRDKSPVKMVLPYSPNEKESINIQSLLDECAEREAQDTTYMFRSLDTFNKGHFHSHKLLIPWQIRSTDGTNITRAEFFAQLWAQLSSLKVKVGDKKAEVPLFQESKGMLIPMPNAILEGMLKVTPDELDRIFAARIAPYYRAIGRMIVQTIGATADDNKCYSIPISGHALPLILRHKLFRGVDPLDECYPLEELIDHAFTLLGMDDMTRDKAFEYFGIDVRDYHDVNGAVKQIRVEIHEMWIKERSLALKALEEGLTLNGLLDMSFCCGLVPMEAVSGVLFSG